MVSEPSQQQVRRTPSEPVFTVPDHARRLALDPRYSVRARARFSQGMPSQPPWPGPGGNAALQEPPAPTLQTAREWPGNGSTRPIPKLKKCRLEHARPSLPGITARWTPTEVCDSFLLAEPATNPIPSDDAFLLTRPMYRQITPQTPSPLPETSFSHTSPYAALSLHGQLAGSRSSSLPIGTKRGDRYSFVGNAPTLHTGFADTTRAPSDWQKLASLDTAQHSLTRLKHPRYQAVSLIGVSLAALLLVALFVQGNLAHQALSPIGTTSITNVSAPPLTSSAPTSTTVPGPIVTQAPTPTLAPAQATTPTAMPALVPTPTSMPTPLPTQAPVLSASKALVRISQLDSSQYASQDEFNTWSDSTCSTAAMTEVFNAYGRHYRITDVLKVESSLGEITPDLGMLSNAAVAQTAAKLGFTTNWGNNWTLDQVLANANAGRPVIVGWPPGRYPEGHLVVVTGGNATTIFLADSSTWDRQEVSYSQFEQWWEGFAAVVTPK